MFWLSVDTFRERVIAPEFPLQKPRANKHTTGKASSYKHDCLLKTLHNYCWLNNSLSPPNLNAALLCSPSSAREEKIQLKLFLTTTSSLNVPFPSFFQHLPGVCGIFCVRPADSWDRKHAVALTFVACSSTHWFPNPFLLMLQEPGSFSPEFPACLGVPCFVCCSEPLIRSWAAKWDKQQTEVIACCWWTLWGRAGCLWCCVSTFSSPHLHHFMDTFWHAAVWKLTFQTKQVYFLRLKRPNYIGLCFFFFELFAVWTRPFGGPD